MRKIERLSAPDIFSASKMKNILKCEVKQRTMNCKNVVRERQMYCQKDKIKKSYIQRKTLLEIIQLFCYRVKRCVYAHINFL